MDYKELGALVYVNEIRFDLFYGTILRTWRITDRILKMAKFYREFENLRVNLMRPEEIFLFKAITERVGDLEDCSRICQQFKLNWGWIFKECLQQEQEFGVYYSFPVLDTLNLLAERYKIEIPIKQKFVNHCLEVGILILLKRGAKGVKELKQTLDFPEYKLRNKLNKLEKEGKIESKKIGRRKIFKLKK